MKGDPFRRRGGRVERHRTRHIASLENVLPVRPRSTGASPLQQMPIEPPAPHACSQNLSRRSPPHGPPCPGRCANFRLSPMILFSESNLEPVPWPESSLQFRTALATIGLLTRPARSHAPAIADRCLNPEASRNPPSRLLRPCRRINRSKSSNFGLASTSGAERQCPSDDSTHSFRVL